MADVGPNENGAKITSRRKLAYHAFLEWFTGEQFPLHTGFVVVICNVAFAIMGHGLGLFPSLAMCFLTAMLLALLLIRGRVLRQTEAELKRTRVILLETDKSRWEHADANTKLRVVLDNEREHSQELRHSQKQALEALIKLRADYDELLESRTEDVIRTIHERLSADEPTEYVLPDVPAAPQPPF